MILRSSVLFGVVLAARASGQPVISEWIAPGGERPLWISALSEDGSTLGGFLNGRAFLMPSSGPLVDLGAELHLVRLSDCTRISGDGSTAVIRNWDGRLPDTSSLWSSHGWGYANIILDAQWRMTACIGTSRDGSIACGLAVRNDGAAGAEVLWRVGGEYTVIWSPGHGPSFACTDLSADGRVVAGYTQGTTAARWEAGSGVQTLGVLPGTTTSQATAISADGRTLAGFSGDRGFVWERARGLVDVGTIPDYQLRPVSLTADGSAFFGRYLRTGGGASTTMVWTREGGRTTPTLFLAGAGVDLTGWRIDSMRCLSADGTTAAGDGVFNGRGAVWVARGLPRRVRCLGDFNRDGFVDPFDYAAFVEAFEAGSPAADATDDGFVDFFDYEGFVAAYEGGC